MIALGARAVIGLAILLGAAGGAIAVVVLETFADRKDKQP